MDPNNRKFLPNFVPDGSWRRGDIGLAGVSSGFLIQLAWVNGYTIGERQIHQFGGNADMDRVWHCRIGEQSLGPMSLHELRFLASQGKLTAAHKVRKGSSGEWTSPAKISGLLGSSRPAINLESELAPIPDLDELEIASTAPVQPLPLRSIPTRKPKKNNSRLIGAGVVAMLLVGAIVVISLVASSGTSEIATDSAPTTEPTVPRPVRKSNPVVTPPDESLPVDQPAEPPQSSVASEPPVDTSDDPGDSEPHSASAKEPSSSDQPTDIAKKPVPPKPDGHPTPTPSAPRTPLTSKGAIVSLTDPFPSGIVFSPTDFKVTPDKLPATARGDERRVIALERRDGSTWGMACQEKGLPHGVTFTTHESQEPMVYLTYEKGSRHGLMRTWTDSGDPLLFTQYEKGRRHGLSCFYGGDGALHAVLEYRLNELSAIRLVQADGVSALEYASETTAQTDKDAVRVLESIKSIEEHVMKNERVFRTQVRKAEAEFRQQLAAELAPIKRANIRERAKHNATLGQRFYEDAVRRHMGR